MSPLRILAAGLLLAALSACTSSIKSDVARFHMLPPPQGETYKIIAMDDGKQNSLEFSTYAQLVANELNKVGYKPTAEGVTPDLEVRMDYGVSTGSEKIDSSPSFTVSPYFYYGRGYHSYGGGYGWYSPFWGGYYGGYYGQPQVYSYTVYTRHLVMNIAKPGTPPRILFEGRVESVGQDNRLPEIMPYLVQALFTDFPGQSGVTKRVVIKLPSK